MHPAAHNHARSYKNARVQSNSIFIDAPVRSAAVPRPFQTLAGRVLWASRDRIEGWSRPAVGAAAGLRGIQCPQMSTSRCAASVGIAEVAEMPTELTPSSAPAASRRRTGRRRPWPPPQYGTALASDDCNSKGQGWDMESWPVGDGAARSGPQGGGGSRRCRRSVLRTCPCDEAQHEAGTAQPARHVARSKAPGAVGRRPGRDRPRHGGVGRPKSVPHQPQRIEAGRRCSESNCGAEEPGGPNAQNATSGGQMQRNSNTGIRTQSASTEQLGAGPGNYRPSTVRALAGRLFRTFGEMNVGLGSEVLQRSVGVCLPSAALAAAAWGERELQLRR